LPPPPIGLIMISRMDRPYVTVSYAQSLDGRIAARDGSSQWISGPASLRLAHRLRRDSDAVVVGIETVIRDDPELTYRPGGRRSLARSPSRVVFDSRLRMPVESKLASTADEIPTTVFTLKPADGARMEALKRRGVRIVECAPNPGGGIGVADVMERLAAGGCRSVFVEGGGRIITSFLRSGVVDRMLVVTAPLIIGAGVEAVGDLGLRTLAESLRPKRARTRRLGPDLVWELLFEPERPGGGRR